MNFKSKLPLEKDIFTDVLANLSKTVHNLIINQLYDYEIIGNNVIKIKNNYYSHINFIQRGDKLYPVCGTLINKNTIGLNTENGKTLSFLQNVIILPFLIISNPKTDVKKLPDEIIINNNFLRYYMTGIFSVDFCNILVGEDVIDNKKQYPYMFTILLGQIDDNEYIIIDRKSVV